MLCSFGFRRCCGSPSLLLSIFITPFLRCGRIPMPDPAGDYAVGSSTRRKIIRIACNCRSLTLHGAHPQSIAPEVSTASASTSPLPISINSRRDVPTHANLVDVSPNRVLSPANEHQNPVGTSAPIALAVGRFGNHKNVWSANSASPWVPQHRERLAAHGNIRIVKHGLNDPE